MRFLAILSLSGASLMALAAPALAQSNTAPADDGIVNSTEIVVTARRRDESVQDVPQTVNVVTAAQIEKLNIRNFTEIASVVPGLQMSAGTFSNTATVRGIAFDPGASGNNPSIEFYLNDSPISSGFLFQSTYDFGQFELQRGPQGTLRGRASPSGSIAVTTRRPDLDEVGFVVNGTVTNLGARKLDGAINVPIIKDVLGIRVAGLVEDTEGSRVHSIWESRTPNFTKEPFRNTRSYRASVRFEPADWASFNVMYQNLHSEELAFAHVVSESQVNPAVAPSGTLIRAFDRKSIDEQGSYNRQDYRALIANAEIRFAGQKLNYVGAFNKQDFGIIGPQDNADYFNPDRITVVARQPGDNAGLDQVCTNEVRDQQGLLTNATFNQCTHSVGKRRSHELRLSSDERIGGIFDYVIGGFYDHNNNPTNLTQETPLVIGFGGVPLSPNPLSPALTSILRRGTSTEKSAFGNLTAHLMEDRLELSGGLRYIDYRNQNALYISARGGPAACGEFTSAATRCGTPTRDSQRTHATIYNASVKYRITPDLMVYALTGSSWRPGPRVVGNFSAGPGGLGQTARELAFTNLPPERSKSYEIGIKASFDNNRGRFNLSAYHQTFQNYPFVGPQVFYISTTNGVESVATANNPGGFGFVSPVPVTVNGVEGEVAYQLLEHWSLAVNAAYADGKVKNGTIACTDLNGDGVPDIGAAQPTLAQLHAAVGAGQTMSVCNGINRGSTAAPKFSANIQSEYGFDVGPDTGAFVRGLYSFYGKTSGNPDNPLDDVGSYGLLNLFAGLRDKDGAWEVSLFAKNILRERQILTLAASNVSTSVQVLNPITFAATGVNMTAPYRAVTVTAPREFGITARVALGSR